MIKVTVFTPTYNRADLLVNLYKSLLNQSDKNFIWLIIDDGSTDNTKDVVEEFKKNADFQIRYIYKENGGLHTGYNEAIKNLDTELSVCIDSDDKMPEKAIEKIYKFWNENGNENVAGIVALDSNDKGEIIGDLLPNIKNINLIDLLVGKYNIINGDRKNVVRSDLYKEVAPMDSINGEKNFNPHYLHLKISLKYDFLVLNESLCIVEYQQEGMSNSIYKQFYNSPNSFIEIRKLYLSFENAPFKFKLRHSIHYISSCFIAKRKNKIKDAPIKYLAVLAYPFGFILSKYIKYKACK